jgi:type IV pilus assembly protein PilM
VWIINGNRERQNKTAACYLGDKLMGFSFKQVFKREKIDVFGLDIGSSQVKIVQLRRHGDNYSVVAAGIAEIKSSNGDAGRREVNTTKAIRRCLDSARAGTNMAVCSVSGPEVAVRYFKFPALSKEEIAGAVLLEAGQVCPFNIDTAVVDYQLIPNGRDNACGVLVAATNTLVQTKKKLTKNVDLSCALVDVDGLALLNCFRELGKGQPREKGASRTVAILDVGSTNTTLAIAGSNNLPFIRDTAYAGNEIIEQIAKEKDIAAEAVTAALFSDKDAADSGPDLGDSLALACKKLIADVTETLRYYGTQEKTAAVGKILVCGGFALAKGFVELLDAHMPGRVVLWDPFKKARCQVHPKSKEILAKSGPVMAVAAGLAMRSV